MQPLFPDPVSQLSLSEGEIATAVDLLLGGDVEEEAKDKEPKQRRTDDALGDAEDPK